MRRALRRLLALTARGPWSTAVLAEFDQTTGTWAAARWTAGGLRVALHERLRARPRLWTGVAVAAAVLVAAPLLLTVRHIPSISMEPTLRVDDWVLVDRVSFRLAGLDHGDVVVVDVRVGDHPAYTTVDRIVGLAGDRIECADGHVVRNGAVVDEPFGPTSCSPVTVPEGEVYLLGDNREVARDSRHFGPLPVTAIRGLVLA